MVILLLLVIPPVITIMLALRYLDRVDRERGLDDRPPASMARWMLTLLAALVVGLVLSAGGCAAYFSVVGFEYHP